VAVLARVTNDPDEPRGPDVMLAVEVPAEWFEQGGGCDLCGRKGAFDQAATGSGSSEVVITLPRQLGGAPSAIRLRLPACGARDAFDEALPPGHLLLTVVPRDAAFGWAPAPSLRKLEEPQSEAKVHWADARMWAIAVVLFSLLLWWVLK
jgi:hypothetical protein